MQTPPDLLKIASGDSVTCLCGPIVCDRVFSYYLFIVCAQTQLAVRLAKLERFSLLTRMIHPLMIAKRCTQNTVILKSENRWWLPICGFVAAECLN